MVTPAPGEDVVKIEILNTIPKAIYDLNYTGCIGSIVDMPHYESFRWFYRLTKDPPATDCKDSYFPCHVGGDFGGRKCPEIEYVP